MTDKKPWTVEMREGGALIADLIAKQLEHNRANAAAVSAALTSDPDDTDPKDAA